MSTLLLSCCWEGPVCQCPPACLRGWPLPPTPHADAIPPTPPRRFFSPPYLSLGPRPDILWGPKDIRPGQDIGLRYTSKDAVQRAILIRTSANTHSIAFDARALWLKIAANKGGWLKLETPDNRSVLPPGM